MEKLIYVLPSASRGSLAGTAPELAEHTRGLTLLMPKNAPGPSQSFAGLLCVWMACLDRRASFEQALARIAPGADAYLVTESMIRDARGPVAQHSEATLVLLRHAPQLGQAELRTQLASTISRAVEQDAVSDRILRDSVVRPLDASARPLRSLFTFVHGARPESAQALQAFDAVCLPAQRETVIVDRQIVRRRSR